MSTPLTDQLRAYFDDVDRQQGAVDIDALRCSVEERVITIELAPHHVVLPNRPSSGRRWPILVIQQRYHPAPVFVAIGVDGPLRPDLSLTAKARGCERRLFRAPFHRYCKPGSTAAPMGQRLHAEALLFDQS